MLLSVITSFFADIGTVGPVSAVTRAARSVKMAKRPADVHFLLTSRAVKAHRLAVAKHDAFFPISHRSYLCKYFDEDERLLAAQQSYAFIDGHFAAADITDMVAKGKTLWRAESNDRVFEIRLLFGNHNMYEGALSAAFYIDGKHVGVMSFSIVDGSLLGLPTGPCMLLCRNQTTSDRWYQKPLQEAFKHIALPYMMIAAVSGVAEALGLKEIYAVTEDGHPHGDKEYVDLMRGSYSGFWEKYGATAFRDGILKIDLPLESTPLDQVSANHRRRAKGRREVMALICDEARSSFAAMAHASAPEAPVAAGYPAVALAPLVLGVFDLLIGSADMFSCGLSNSCAMSLLS